MSNENDIIAAKEAVTEAWLRRPGVTGMDVGFKYVRGKRTGEVAIRLFVRKKLANVAPEERFPSMIGTHKTDVIEREFTPIDLPDVAFYDPVVGGIQLSSTGTSATAGMFFTDNLTGQLLLLGTFHGGVALNEPIYQPKITLPDGATGQIGHLIRHGRGLVPPIDADLFLYGASRGTHCSITELGEVEGVRQMVLSDMGESVRKRGRTTGVTWGTLDGISASVTADGGSTTYSNLLSFAVDKSKSTTMAVKGDSGSVVLDASNKAIAMLAFASSDSSFAYGFSIPEIMSKLAVTPCFEETVLPRTVILTSTEYLAAMGGGGGWEEEPLAPEWLETKSGVVDLKACPLWPTKSYEYAITNVYQKLVVSALAIGFDQPLFSWTVNGQKLNDFSKSEFTKITIMAWVEYYDNPVQPDQPSLKHESVTLSVSAFHAASYTKDGTFGTLVLFPTKVQGHILLDVKVDVRGRNVTSPGDISSQSKGVQLSTQIFAFEPAYYLDRAECEKSWRPLPPGERVYTIIDYIRDLPTPWPTFRSGISFLVQLDKELEELSRENPKLAHELSGSFEQRLNLPDGFLAGRRRIGG